MEDIYSNKMYDLTYNDKEKILSLIFKRGSSIDGKIAEKLVELSSEISKHEPHANFVDMRNMLFLSKEGRSVFGNSDKSTVLCIAVVINSKFQKSLGNMYLRFNKPIINTRLFENEVDAMSWIKEVLNEKL